MTPTCRTRIDLFIKAIYEQIEVLTMQVVKEAEPKDQRVPFSLILMAGGKCGCFHNESFGRTLVTYSLKSEAARI